MDAEISAVSLHELSRALLPQPQIVDVRAEDTFARDRRMIPGAVRRSPDIAQWQSTLEPWRAVVVYCDHGHEASRNAATTMRERGYDARHLAGGYAAWAGEGLPLVPFSPPTRWVTRERLSQMFADDHAMLRFGMLVYDALYAWCREAAREAHCWNPAALRQAMASSVREA